MNKFFLVWKSEELRAEITSFNQHQGESLCKVWERFKLLIASCPTHGTPLYQLITIFYPALDTTKRATIKNYIGLKFVTMDPLEAWAQLDEVTSHELTYDLPANPRGKARGLYEVSAEVDKDVRAQYQADEANRLKKQVSSLKACQLCQSPAHTVVACPNMNQVHAAQEFADQEARLHEGCLSEPELGISTED